MTKIESIIEQAQAGRGLWLGMKICGIPDEYVQYFDDPHVTLVHLGKKNKQEAVEAAFCAGDEALEELKLKQTCLRFEITGIGFLYRAQTKATPVMLINSYQLCELYHSLQHWLQHFGIKVGKYYGFVPHVTLKQREDYHEQTTFNRFIQEKRFECFTYGLQMFCGDAEPLMLSAESPF